MSDNSLPITRARFAHTIFCDDLRREDSGKLLVIGMYGSELLVQQLPAVLPGLNFLITVSTPVEDLFTSLTIRVMLGEETLSEMVVDSLPSSDDANQNPEDVTAGRVYRLQALAKVGILTIEKPTLLRVRVFTEREVLQAGALRIAEVRTDDQAAIFESGR